METTTTRKPNGKPLIRLIFFVGKLTELGDTIYTMSYFHPNPNPSPQPQPQPVPVHGHRVARKNPASISQDFVQNTAVNLRAIFWPRGIGIYTCIDVK